VERLRLRRLVNTTVTPELLHREMSRMRSRWRHWI
jgi:hypothetical protein